MYAIEHDEDVLSVIEELIERRAADRPDDAIVPHGIEDAVIDVREDVSFASADDNADRYESELRRLSEFVQSRHPSGAVKHIGLMEAVPSAMELISEASEWIGRQLKDDDNEPITAKWWRDVFCSLWYGDINKSWWLERNDIDSSISLRCECGSKEPTLELPHIRTRGDLRRLWLALTGRELNERKAGE